MKQIQADHELDKMFDITPGQTYMTLPGSDVVVSDEDEEEVEGDSTSPIVPVPTAVESYDTKDREIEKDLTDVQHKAVEAYESLMIAAQSSMDKKYMSTNAEVAATFLQIALNAVKEKNSTKERKDKIVVAREKSNGKTGPKGSITNHNQIVTTDRQTLLAMLRGESK